MPFPFYWEKDTFKNMSEKENNFFNEAKNFNITTGTTIPLTPNNNKTSYLTILDLDLTNNFNLLFWLRASANAYFKKKDEITNLKNKDS